jgi:hypothetical protein
VWFRRSFLRLHGRKVYLEEVSMGIILDLIEWAAHRHDEIQAIEVDDHGWMHGSGVVRVPSKRTQRLMTPRPPNGDAHVEGICAHWTDTRCIGAEALAKRIVDMPKKDQHVGSCHVWIDAGGAIAQSVSFEQGSWHAGSASALLFTRGGDGTWTGSKIKGYSANRWAAGIELECIGDVRLLPLPARGPLRQRYERHATKDGHVWCGWPFVYGGDHGNPASCPADEVVVTGAVGGQQRGLHKFTDEQVRAATRVYRAIISTYGLKRENCAWGHNLIDPKRRTDPGPLWMNKGGHLENILNGVYNGV